MRLATRRGRRLLAAGGLLLLPALGVTAVRLLPLGSGRALQLEAFTPFALVPYAGSLVLLAASTWRREGARRAVPAVGVVLALTGLGLHAWWVAPMWLGHAPAAAAGSTPLRVMTANLYEGRADPAELVDRVRAERPDVLVLQEVGKDLLPALDALGLGDLLPHRIGAPDPVDPVGGTMVLSTRPLGPATRVDTLHQSWLVEVGEGSEAVRLLAVHPVAPVDPEHWHSDFAAILAAARSARPDLVVGDLNATLDHAPVRDLDALGLHDAALLADSGWQPTWPSDGLGPRLLGVAMPPVVAIDHVLLGPRWTALSTHTLDVPRSDHRALVADLAPVE